MYVEQLYTGCLAEAAYYIESEGEAVIIDPLRETDPYTQLAEKRGARIKFILETHFHADFVSGHVDLANKTGAMIVYGPNAKPGYDIHVANDGDVFEVGKVKIKILHTPGHTMESTTYLLLDQNGKEHAIFTGDTLFIGDVGRPDLAVKNGSITKEDLAGHLYDSLQNKIMTLPDDVIVYPGHGAGSSCGKNMSDETTSTLGEQKRFNYALQAKTKDEFVAQVLDGLGEPPAYFKENAKINMSGYEAIDDVMARNAKALSVAQVEAEMQKGAMVLDTRATAVFSPAHLPSAVNIGLEGQYAPWVGAVIPFGQRLVLVTDNAQEAVLRLARVGYENVAGYLEGGVEAWKTAGKPTETVHCVQAQGLADLIQNKITVLDVRRATEFELGHVAQANHICLTKLRSQLSTLNPEQPYAVYCAGGYRSMIAASMLKREGFKTLINIEGGYGAIEKVTNLTLEKGLPASV